MYEEQSFRHNLSDLSASLSPIWPAGRNPSSVPGDGPHHTLAGFQRPVSLGQVEAMTLKNIAQSLPVEFAFEIGTGFGYSSWWIAAGIAMGGAPEPALVSLDSQSEGGLASNGRKFAEGGAEKLGLDHIIKYVVGRSPEAVAGCLGGRLIDLALIDGDHHGDQPILDYLALNPHMGSDSLLLFHDVEPRYSVADALLQASRDGWSTVVLPTSCRLGACYKSVRSFDCLMNAFNSARSSGSC